MARRMARPDWVVGAILVATPTALLTAAALAGYPLLTGDNVVQNFPLAALSGQALSHGHLPVYDPYAWSGSPLLAAANAHALLPTTWLFALVPSAAAWVCGESLVFAAAGLGTFAFLRRTGCRTAAAGLGAATFELGGFFTSQSVHIDFISAAACLPWVLLSMREIALGAVPARPRWAAVLALSVTLIALAASPDLVIDAVALSVAYGVHLLAALRRRGLAPTLWAGAGIGAGLAAGAVQWLPTAKFVAVSQRAHVGVHFTAAGSLQPSALVVSLLPHLLGGGPIGLEQYVGPYNLAELDAYPGLVALAAIGGLATIWRSQAARRFRVFYVVAALGLLLALGSNTPLESLLVHLPIVGQQRLPSRALILVALASSMLTGYYADEILGTAVNEGVRRPAGLAAAVVGPGCVLGLVVATVASGRPYGGILGPAPGANWALHKVAVYLVVVTALVAGALLVLAGSARWSSRVRRRALFALVAADLLVFAADQSSFAPVRAVALGQANHLERELRARLGGSRFLLVDPARTGGVALDEIGTPNIGALFGLASAGGSGSLVWGPYAQATGTHGQNVVRPSALGSSLFDTLDVRVLVTVPSELAVPVAGGVTATAEPLVVPPGSSAGRWFGQDLSVTAITLTGVTVSGSGSSRLGEIRGRPDHPGGTLRLLGTGFKGYQSSAASGRGHQVAAITAGSATETFRLARPAMATGLEITDGPGRRVRVDSVMITTSSGRRLSLSGPLAGVLSLSHWAPELPIGPFSVFRNQRARGAYWTEGPVGRPVSRRVIRVVSSSSWQPTEVIAVTASAPTTLVRSVADIPGWSVTESSGGRSREVAISRYGLVQAVQVPEGSTTVTFRYAPPGLRAGEVLSLAGLLALAFLSLVPRRWLDRRRRVGASIKGGASDPLS